MDAVLKDIERFEIATGFMPFKKFHRAQVLAFRDKLAEEVGPGGQPLSAATIMATLKHFATSSFGCRVSRDIGKP